MKKTVALPVGALLATLAVVSLWLIVDDSGSPGGPQGRIAFTSDQSGDHEVWLVNADGSGLRRLTGDDTPQNKGSLAWSPDGDQIMFIAGWSEGGEPVDIYIVDADGSHLLRLTDTPAEERAPQFLPDGRILYWERGTGTWVMDGDGSNKHQVDGRFRPGALSPDGTQLLFVLGTGGLHYETSEVRISGLEDVRGRALTEEMPYTREPTWSRDGKSIAMLCANVEGYVSYPGAPPQDQESPGICLINSDGTGLRRVVEASATPALSPDGRWVAFAGGDGLQVASVDDSEARLLVNCACLQLNGPVWSPR